jgi:hypothetical protein
MLRHSAEVWFFSDRQTLGSFRWICDQLEFDAGWLRRRLLEMADRKSSVSMNLRRRERPKAGPPAEALRPKVFKEGLSTVLSEIPEGSANRQPEMATCGAPCHAFELGLPESM